MSRTPNGPRYGTFVGNGAEYASILQVVMVVFARLENEILEREEQSQNLRATQQILLQLTEMLGKCWVHEGCSMDCGTVHAATEHD